METINIRYVNETCITCGAIFGINATQHSQIKESKRTFYCPNGHSMFYRESTTDVLREEIAQKDRLISSKNEEIARLSKLKAKRRTKVGK